MQNAHGSNNLHIGTHSSAHALWEQSFRLLQWLSSSTEGKEDLQRHIPNCLAVCLLVMVATQFDTWQGEAYISFDKLGNASLSLLLPLLLEFHGQSAIQHARQSVKDFYPKLTQHCHCMIWI